MTKYTCIIIDDETQAIELLAYHIKRLNKNIDILNTYTSWSKAIEGLRSQEFDILFLDISIHNKNGMDLLKLVPNTRCEVIFITAHSNYALDAFQFSPSGYILKPIDEIALATTLDKAIERVQQRKSAMQLSEMQLTERVGIFNNKGIDYVDVHDIIYFEGLKQYTKVVTLKAEFTSSHHLGKFSHITCKHPFYKVHRSFVINLNHILRYETSGIVIMSNRKEIPVSRTSRNDFQKIFNTIH